jgi:TonB family protein
MSHSNPNSRISFIGTRALVFLPALFLLLPFVELSNRAAEETVVVKTDRVPPEAHPVYVIAVPRQEKLAPRPLDIPIISSRVAPTPTPSPTPTPTPTPIPTATPEDDDFDGELTFPTFPLTAEQAVRIGNGLNEDGEFQLALPYFQEAQKQQQPNQPQLSLAIRNGFAHCYYGLKRDDEALAIYNEVAAQNTGFWPAQFNVGRIHLENGRYAEAVEALSNAQKLRPDDLVTVESLGIALTKHGRGAEAIPLLTRVVEKNTYVTESFYNLGEAYAVDQQWLKAADIFKQGADKYGKDPNGYYYWGVMLFNADKLDEAFEAFQKVRRVDVTAKHVGAAFYIAEIYRLRGKLQDALAQYQVVLNLKPDEVESLFQAGYLSFKLGQRDPAQHLFKRLIDVNPVHAGGAANWAALEARENEVRKSRNEKTPGITLRNVVQANPGSVEAHINLGAQLITEEEYSEAVTVLEKAVSLRPGSPAAHYNLGLAQLKTRAFDRSVISNSKALELKPEWPDAYNNLGLAYGGLKRWDEAAKAAREALRIVPSYTGAYFNLGIASLRMGQIDVAHQLVEKLKPMSWAHQARLAHEILAVERPGALPIVTPTPLVTPAPGPVAIATPPVVTATPEPSPTPPPVALPETTPSPTPASTPAPTPAPEEECPEPIYRPAGVTQMASIAGPLEVAYTEDAVLNRVEGRIVLQVVLCGNGRVSDITVEERLPFGLTERAIEAMRKIQFQPATKNSVPVTVIVKQAFNCAQRVCTAVGSP